MRNFIIVLVCAAALSSCTQINSLGVEADENAVACLKADANTNATVINGQSSGRTIEVGRTDTTAWTADDWAALFKACFND